jgi:hypothetical protein
MKVTFFVKQINEKQETREEFLFSDEYAEMMANKQIDHQGLKFQVNSLEWMNDKRTELKAVCLEIL